MIARKSRQEKWHVPVCGECRHARWADARAGVCALGAAKRVTRRTIPCAEFEKAVKKE